MSNNQNTTIQLNDNDLTTLIKSLSASNHYHKNYNDLSKDLFIDDDELKDIIENNDRIKQILKDSLQVLDTSCPRSSETVKPALVAVNGDIHSYLAALKLIADQLSLLNSCAFDNSILSDEEHYALLEIDLRTQELITGKKIICFHSYPVNGCSIPSNLE